MSNIDNLTYGELKQIAAMFQGQSAPQQIQNGMIGKYVIVRCRDAGVHAGVLESYNGRECVLNESRRLWYWKPADNQKFLSGAAVAGLASDSKVGAPIRVHLTENCEIIECTDKAEKSIRGAKTDEI
jgi:hypothetical protein